MDYECTSPEWCDGSSDCWGCPYHTKKESGRRHKVYLQTMEQARLYYKELKKDDPHPINSYSIYVKGEFQGLIYYSTLVGKWVWSY